MLWMCVFHSPETYNKNVCIVYSLHVSLFIIWNGYTHSFSGDICHECVYSCVMTVCMHCMCLYSLHGLDTHIRSQETYVMNVCIHYVCLGSFSGEICYGCVYSLRVSLFITCIFSSDICYECVYFIL